MFQILTDSACDLTPVQLSDLCVEAVPLTVHYDEETAFPDGSMDPEEFYAGVRSGKLPKTSAVNPDQWAQKMEAALRQGRDLLVITMASGISATYQSAVIAAGELQERYPDREIRVLDSTTAAHTQGLLVRKAAQLRDRGQSLAAVAEWVEEHKGNFCIWVTVEDLMHLKRGGRLGTASAVAGTMLQIKPLLHLDDQGRLAQGPKVRGKKAALQTLAQLAQKSAIPEANALVVVGHTGNLEEAQTLAELLREATGAREVLLGHIGTVIGSHVGPGALTVSYVGRER